MAFVYILHSEKDGGWYIGQTRRDLGTRLKRHRSGSVPSTKHRRPLSLAYFEEVDPTISQKREWLLKSTKGYLEKRRIVEHLSSQRHEWPIQGPITNVKLSTDPLHR